MISFLSQSKLRLMGFVLTFSFLLMSLKFGAYWLTQSQAILTDALESIINVVAGTFAFVSLYYADRPRDLKHPYGHGKLEYVSAGVEGALISVAGVFIVWEAVSGIVHPRTVHELGWGMGLTVFSGLLNGLVGWLLVNEGKKNNSAVMEADGKHLITDTISSVGLLVGLLAIYFTQLLWLDGAVALVLGVYIVVTGFSMLKSSVGVLIDEADYRTLDQVAEVLKHNRAPRWIDIHNLRVQKFGQNLHIDCHLTLPWYSTLEQSHTQASNLEKMLKSELGQQTELFVHTDPCVPSKSCTICPIAECSVRQSPRLEDLNWSLENLLPNEKHQSQHEEFAKA